MTFSATDKFLKNHSNMKNLTNTERERLEKCRVVCEVALRQKYGARLADITVQFLLEEMADDPRVTNYMILGDTEQCDPENRESWLAFAETLVAGSEMARRNISFTDEAAKISLSQDFLAALKPHEKLRLARNPAELKERQDAFIEAGLEEKSRAA